MAMRKAPPKKFHFDCRIKQILEALKGGNADDFFCTKRAADLFGVSKQWFEIARCGGYGPEPTVLSPRRIRYTRQSLVKFLRGRLYPCESDSHGNSASGA
jgi:hypothetical protein